MVPKICYYLAKQDNQKEHREKYKSKHLYGQHVTFVWAPLSYTKSSYHRWTWASSDLVPREYHQQAWTWCSESNTCKPQSWHSESTIQKSWLSSLNLTHNTLSQYPSQLPARKSAKDTTIPLLRSLLHMSWSSFVKRCCLQFTWPLKTSPDGDQTAFATWIISLFLDEYRYVIWFKDQSEI